METALISVLGGGFVALISAFAYFYLEDRKDISKRGSDMWGEFNAGLAELRAEGREFRGESKKDIDKLGGRMETRMVAEGADQRGMINKLDSELKTSVDP